MIDRNGWGSVTYSKIGLMKPIVVDFFSGWVVGAETRGAMWQQMGIVDSKLNFSIHASTKGQTYAKKGGQNT